MMDGERMVSVSNLLRVVLFLWGPLFWANAPNYSPNFAAAEGADTVVFPGGEEQQGNGETLLPGSNDKLSEESATTSSSSMDLDERQEAEIEAASASSSSLLDDRTWLDIFGEVAKDYLTHQLIPPTDIGCVWDWRIARCEPSCKCVFRFQPGDYHLGRSCRFKPEVERRFCPPPDQADNDENKPGNSNTMSPTQVEKALFRTVQFLHMTRDQVQEWTKQLKSQSKHSYEQIQNKMCADIISSNNNIEQGSEKDSSHCIPVQSLNWKQKVVCRRLDQVCDEESFHDHNKNGDDHQIHEFFPGWSVGGSVINTDWIAGIHTSPGASSSSSSSSDDDENITINNSNNKIKRRPKVTRSHNNMVNSGGFANIPKTMTANNYQNYRVSEKTQPQERHDRQQQAQNRSEQEAMPPIDAMKNAPPEESTRTDSTSLEENEVVKMALDHQESSDLALEESSSSYSADQQEQPASAGYHGPRDKHEQFEGASQDFPTSDQQQ